MHAHTPQPCRSSLELFNLSRSSAPRSILIATGSLAGNVALSVINMSQRSCYRSRTLRFPIGKHHLDGPLLGRTSSIPILTCLHNTSLRKKQRGMSSKDAFDFAEETAQSLKNKLDGDWIGWSVEVRDAEGRKYFHFVANQLPFLNGTLARRYRVVFRAVAGADKFRSVIGLARHLFACRSHHGRPGSTRGTAWR
jgi:hypothetical protein